MSKEIIMAGEGNLPTEAPQSVGEAAPGQGGVATLTKELSGNVPEHSRDVASPEARIKDWLQGRLEEPVQNETNTEQQQLNPKVRADIENALGNADADSLVASQQKSTIEQVMANALLSDEKRLQAAEKLLGPLTEEQEKALKRMHEVGKDRPGAGVYNYNRAEIKEKVRIGREKTETGEEVFSKEQRRRLFESGIAGVLSSAEIAARLQGTFNDPTIQKMVGQVQRTGALGNADERFLERMSQNLETLYYGGTVALDDTETQNLQDILERLRIEAASQRPQPDRRPERRENFTESLFEQKIREIDVLEQSMVSMIPGSPQYLAAENNLDILKVDRYNLLVEARDLGFLRPVKQDLFETYYDSRVEVTNKEKIAKRRQDGSLGVLRNLENLEHIAITGSWEASVRFWNDPVRAAQVGRLGGVVDYFERESLKIITEVVNDRKKYGDPYNPEPYPDKGIIDIWDYQYVFPGGRRRRNLETFTEVRDFVEEERKRKPKIPNRGDYESWFALVADDPEEAEEMIPHVVASVRGKMVGGPQSQSQTLQAEQEKWSKAIDYLKHELEFPDESPEFVRLATMVRQELNLLGVDTFSNLVKETWEPYLQYATDIARGFKDTEFQDHTIDVLLLDREGIKLAALELLAIKDWEYYRFGRNTKDTNETLSYGDALKIQQERRKWIINWLVDHELRPMNDLLNADINQNGQVVINGDPTHPAFQRMKIECDALDAKDTTNHIPLVDPNDPVDVNGNPKLKTRWQEYIEKAILWQRTGESSDPRDKIQRVIFQHPLARAFRPAGFKDEQGDVTRVDEFWTMFRKASYSDPKEERRVKRGKRERVNRALRSSERLVKFSASDAVAGGPRHFFDVYNDTGTLTSPHGEIITNAQGQEFLKLPTGAELRIERDSNGEPFVNDVEPHMKTLRDLMQRIVETDEQKPVKRRLMKLYRIMKNKVGLDLPLPGFSDWYLGAHDSNRPHLLKFLRQVPEWDQQLEERAKLREFDAAEGNDGYGYGADPKTDTARDPEDGRRLRILAEVYLKNKFKHYNYPGQDDPEGGVKEFRNLLYQVYGISMGTVEVNALIGKAWLGEVDFLGAFGCETWKQLVGRIKGPNEVVYALTRGFFVNPRDAEGYEKRLAAIVEQAKMWNGGDENSPDILNKAPISGAYHARAINLEPDTYLSMSQDEVTAAELNPVGYGYDRLKEGMYEKYVETSARIAAPLAKIMEARLKLENVYGRNPQSAMFLNTLLWYDVLKWMDENPEEFRSKFGFAYDVNLPMARRFIHTFFYESRLIYSDEQWDRIMLGYTIPKDQWEAIKNWSGNPDTKPQVNSIVRAKTGINRVDKFIRYNADTTGNTVGYVPIKDAKSGAVIEWKYDRNNTDVVEGEVVEGLLDALPPRVREEALSKRWIPVGISSYYPETLDSLRRSLPNDGIRNKRLYQDILEKVVKEDIAKANDPNYTSRIVKERRPIKRV